MTGEGGEGGEEGEEENCHMLITSLLNEGAVIKRMHILRQFYGTQAFHYGSLSNV
jgi:hypothetical protein